MSTSPSLVKFSDQNRFIRRSFSMFYANVLHTFNANNAIINTPSQDYFQKFDRILNRQRYECPIHAKKNDLKARLRVVEASLKRIFVILCCFSSSSKEQKQESTPNYHALSLRVFLILYEN